MSDVTAVYRVTMLVDPGIALRALNLFAQRALVPDRFDLVRDAETQRLTVQQSGLAPDAAAIIAAKLAAFVGVIAVESTTVERQLNPAWAAGQNHPVSAASGQSPAAAPGHP